jgi:integrase
VDPVTRPDGTVSPWVFPVRDARKRRRFRDALGRVQPVRGDRRSPGTGFFGAKLRQALTAAGIERRVTVHGLRRTFAVLLQESGAPDSVIRQALGHGERGVTELNYLPRRDDAIKRWVDAIGVRVPSLESTPGARSGRRAPYLRLVK